MPKSTGSRYTEEFKAEAVQLAVHRQDVVTWYAAHFTHDVEEEEVGHYVGPVLRPTQW
jgi:transposase-like protein